MIIGIKNYHKLIDKLLIIQQKFLWVFLPCMDIHIGFQSVIIAFIPVIFKHRGNFAL